MLYLRPLGELKKTVGDLKIKNNNHNRKNFEIACTFICAVSNKEPEKARERAAKTLAFYIATGKYYSKFLSENGFREDVEQIISEYRNKGGDSAAKVVSNKMLESLTICGNSEECNKSLARFRSTGITLPIIQLNPLDNTESSFMEVLSTF